jgi:hypothetical protein
VIASIHDRYRLVSARQRDRWFRIHPHGRKVWLRPGVTGDSRDPLGPVVPQQRLQPGAVPPVGAD